MLEAVLREWPVVHRAILLQGELLSVDDTCPVIITSFHEEECNHEVSPNTATVSLGMMSAVAVAMLALVALVVMAFILYKKYVDGKIMLILLLGISL